MKKLTIDFDVTAQSGDVVNMSIVCRDARDIWSVKAQLEECLENLARRAEIEDAYTDALFGAIEGLYATVDQLNALCYCKKENEK